MLQRQFQAAGTLPGDKNNNNELLILNLAAVSAERISNNSSSPSLSVTRNFITPPFKTK